MADLTPNDLVTMARSLEADSPWRPLLVQAWEEGLEFEKTSYMLGYAVHVFAGEEHKLMIWQEADGRVTAAVRVARRARGEG